MSWLRGLFPKFSYNPGQVTAIEADGRALELVERLVVAAERCADALETIAEVLTDGAREDRR